MAKTAFSALDVSLMEITASTVRSVLDLRVRPDQKAYVASNAVSIAQAHFHPEAWFRAVYAAGTPIGFVMLRDPTLLDPVPQPALLSLWRLMIDRNFQGRGFGRKALELAVAHAQTRPGADAFHTSYLAGEHAPRDFYLAFGFEPTGTPKENGEIDLVFDLGRRRTCAGDQNRRGF